MSKYGNICGLHFRREYCIIVLLFRSHCFAKRVAVDGVSSNVGMTQLIYSRKLELHL